MKALKRSLRTLLVGILKWLPPKTLLRWLLRLDTWLYYLQGQAAIRYGGGIHPKHRLIHYHDFFVGRIQAGERILDIGCGNGAVARDIAERSGARVVGIDINPENIKIAAEINSHPEVRYLSGDIWKEIPDGNFDVILLSNVLEHLEDRPLILDGSTSSTQDDERCPVCG